MLCREFRVPTNTSRLGLLKWVTSYIMVFQEELLTDWGEGPDKAELW